MLLVMDNAEDPARGPHEEQFAEFILKVCVYVRGSPFSVFLAKVAGA